MSLLRFINLGRRPPPDRRIDLHTRKRLERAIHDLIELARVQPVAIISVAELIAGLVAVYTVHSAEQAQPTEPQAVVRQS
jgi:hypothetical protein